MRRRAAARDAAGAARRAAHILAAAALLLVSGCGDVQDVNQRTLVYAVGLDAAPGDAISVSIHYLSPHTAIGGGGGGGAGGGGGGGGAGLVPVTDTAVSRTVGGALDELRTAIPGGLFLGTVRVILFGRALAERGIRPVLDHFMRTPREPTTTWVAVVDGRAEDLLRGPSPGEVSPARTVSTVLAVDATETLGIDAVRQWEVVNGALVPASATPVALFASTPDGPEVTGAAVFRGDRMITAVALRDAALLRAMRTPGTAELTFDPPPGRRRPIAARIQAFAIRPRLQPDGRTVDVSVRGSAFVVDSPEVEVGIEGAPIVERQIDRQLEAWTLDLLKRMYAQRLDVLALGETVREAQPDGRLPPDWLERMTRLRFRARGEVRVVHGERGY